MTDAAYTPDHERAARIGLDEAVFCGSKSVPQISAILERESARGGRLLLTRLDAARFEALAPHARAALDYDPESATAVLGGWPEVAASGRVAVISAGTSDLGTAREAVRTLRLRGEQALEVHDVGVAGLWRVMKRIEELRTYPVLIVTAGMDAALPSVLGGLLPGVIIAVPTSAGYGVAAGGETALRAMLASCAPGVCVMNIDNGYGAACAALRVLAQLP